MWENDYSTDEKSSPQKKIEYVDEDKAKMIRGMMYGMSGDKLKDTTKTTATSLVVGGVVGGFIGLYLKTSVLLLTFIGAASGLAYSHLKKSK